MPRNAAADGRRIRDAARGAVYLRLHLAYDLRIVDKRSAAERVDFPMET
jgi:hypothetical protein